MSMANVYKIDVTEEIIGHSNGQKQVLVTVATSRTTGDKEQTLLKNGAVKVTLSKVGRISSIVPLPIGMVAGANVTLTSTIVGEGNIVEEGNIVGEGNTVTITVLKADADAENPDAKNLAVPATDGDLVPANSEDGVTSGVTFNFIAIGL